MPGNNLTLALSDDVIQRSGFNGDSEDLGFTRKVPFVSPLGAALIPSPSPGIGREKDVEARYPCQSVSKKPLPAFDGRGGGEGCLERDKFEVQ
jgi:hypothetical protein